MGGSLYASTSAYSRPLRLPRTPRRPSAPYVPCPSALPPSALPPPRTPRRPRVPYVPCPSALPPPRTPCRPCAPYVPCPSALPTPRTPCLLRPTMSPIRLSVSPPLHTPRLPVLLRSPRRSAARLPWPSGYSAFSTPLRAAGSSATPGPSAFSGSYAPQDPFALSGSSAPPVPLHVPWVPPSSPVPPRLPTSTPPLSYPAHPLPPAGDVLFPTPQRTVQVFGSGVGALDKCVSHWGDTVLGDAQGVLHAQCRTFPPSFSGTFALPSLGRRAGATAGDVGSGHLGPPRVWVRSGRRSVGSPVPAVAALRRLLAPEGLFPVRP